MNIIQDYDTKLLLIIMGVLFLLGGALFQCWYLWRLSDRKGIATWLSIGIFIKGILTAILLDALTV